MTSDTRRPNASVCGRPRTVDTIEARRIENVVSLMPPPVDPDAVPMNINAIPTSRLEPVSWPIGIVVIPAERNAIDSNRALSGRWSGGSAPSVRGFDHSNTSSASIPPTMRTIVIRTTELGLERETDPAAFRDQVAHDRDAEAAEHDQHRERDEHQRVAREAAQAVEAAHQVEAGVVERRDRVEHAVPRALGNIPVADRERDRQREGADALRDEREGRNTPEHGPHRAEVPGTC